MNMKRPLCPLGMMLLALSGTLAAADPPGTAFTYQGRLSDGGSPAQGNYDFWFKLYDDPNAGHNLSTVALTTQAVSNGLFTVPLDFGPGALAGGSRWLEVWVHTNDPAAPDVVLTPRQAITPAPLSLWTPAAGTAVLASKVPSGAIAAADLDTSAAPTKGQLLSFDGIALVWATVPIGWGASWLLGGNVATAPAVNFLGTRDDGPLQLRVNGTPALAWQPTPAGGVSVVGGQAGSVDPSVDYGTVAGGHANGILGSAHGATIAGGQQNQIGVNSQIATLGGGGGNHLGSHSWLSAIGGGQANAVGDGLEGGVIAGGNLNTLGEDGCSGVIGGGGGNHIGAAADYDNIGGGAGNQIVAGAWYSVLEGGTGNLSGSNYVALTGGSNNVASGSFSTLSGGGGNVATNAGDVIGGGVGNTATGGNSTLRGGQFNRTEGLTSTAGGGNGNWAEEWDSTIVGGATNWANGVSSTITGGAWNEAVNYWGTVGGGQANSAGYITTIVGGFRNVGDNMGAIGGGSANVAAGWCGTVPGGYTNTVYGAYSFAAGRKAGATADGAFVWADTSDALFSCVVTNRFAVRALGGLLLNAGTNNFEIASGGLKVTGAGVATSTPVFVHKATSGNINGYYTTISNPRTDGHPNAILWLTHNWNQDTMSETHPVGVFYSGGHWAIYHEDGATMPVGAAYNVLVVTP